MIALAYGHIVFVPYQILRTVIRGGFLWDVDGSMIHLPRVMMKSEASSCHVSSHSKVPHDYDGNYIDVSFVGLHAVLVHTYSTHACVTTGFIINNRR